MHCTCCAHRSINVWHIRRRCHTGKKCFSIDSVTADLKDPWTIFPGRAAAVKVHGFLKGGIIFVTIYLITQQPPSSTDNWQILLRVAEILLRIGLPFCIGGDFQCTPEVLTSTGWLETVRGQIRRTSQGTCRHATGTSELDFFVISNSLDSAASDARVCLSSSTFPHYPIDFRLGTQIRSARVRAFKAPKQFPKTVPIGPARKPTGWPQFDPSGYATAIERNDALAPFWIRNTEQDLCRLYDKVNDDDGTPLKEYTGRSAKPCLVWTSPFSHPVGANCADDVRTSFWVSIMRRMSDIILWYNACIAHNLNHIWYPYSYHVDNARFHIQTRQAIQIAAHIYVRFQNPPKAVLAFDTEAVNAWKQRCKLIYNLMNAALMGFPDGGLGTLQAWKTDIEAHVDILEKDLVNKRSTEFAKWIDDQLKTGGKQLHQATKEPIPTLSDNVDDYEPGEHCDQIVAEADFSAGRTRTYGTPQMTNRSTWPAAKLFFGRRTCQASDPCHHQQHYAKYQHCSPRSTSTGADAIHPRAISPSPRYLPSVSRLALRCYGSHCRGPDHLSNHRAFHPTKEDWIVPRNRQPPYLLSDLYSYQDR